MIVGLCISTHRQGLEWWKRDYGLGIGHEWESGKLWFLYLLGRPLRKWYVNIGMDIKRNVLFVCFMHFRIGGIYRLFWIWECTFGLHKIREIIKPKGELVCMFCLFTVLSSCFVWNFKWWTLNLEAFARKWIDFVKETFHVQTDVCEFGNGIENYMSRRNLHEVCAAHQIDR